MESKTQEQVLGRLDRSYWFQVNFEYIKYARGVINALLVAPSGTA